MARKKRRYSIYITNKTKLNETKLIKMIYTAINSKLINIVRVQKEQGTEAMSKKPCYNINVVVVTLC